MLKIKNPQPETEPLARLSQSAIMSWLSCPRKAELSREGWRTVRASEPLTFGTLVHHVLEKVFGELKRKPTQDEILGLVRDAEKNADVGRASPEQLETLERCAGSLEILMPRYFDRWSKDFEQMDYSMVEAEFLVDFHGKFNMFGYFDRVLLRNKKMWLIDTKTKSRIEDETICETLHFDFQFMYFMLALYKMTGKPPAGAIMDIVRRPGLKVKVGEDVRGFLVRLEKDIDSRPEFYFVRFEVAISKVELDAFEQKLLPLADAYIKWRRGELPTWQNTTSCTSKGFNCDYLPICSRDDYSIYHKTTFQGRKK